MKLATFDDRRNIAEGLWDGSAKPGEALCYGFVPDLQRTAQAMLIIEEIADSPNKKNLQFQASEFSKVYTTETNLSLRR